MIDPNDIVEFTGNQTVNGNPWSASTSTDFFYFDSSSYNQSSTPYQPGKYRWLYDRLERCARQGCKVEDNNSYINVTRNSDFSVYGYWTSTPAGEVGKGSGIWAVRCYGSLDIMHVDRANFGVRPVITVSKNKLS